MGEGRVEIVCVNAGDKFPDYYVERLFNMVGRNFSRAFQLTCFTDRKRDVSTEIQQVDISQLCQKGPFNKLLLYDPETMPYREALFLDITMAIKEDITHFVDHAKGLDKDLVAIHDWRRPVMNSCVQWITQSDTTRAVWDVYQSDQYPEFRVKGDQFFTYSTLGALGIEDNLGYFPKGQIQSYKILREAHRVSDEKFEELWRETKIVKFHGVPRATEILDPWKRITKVALRYPQWIHKDWNFLVKEIEEMWQ